MTLQTETITAQHLLELAQEEAVTLYLTDQCSLGRAAELADITRWELQDILYERGTPVAIYGRHTAEEIDTLAGELEVEG